MRSVPGAILAVPMRARVWMAVLLLLGAAGNADAYIDPGSGSLVIQALVAGLVTAILFFRRAVIRVLQGLRRAFGRRPDVPDDSR